MKMKANTLQNRLVSNCIFEGGEVRLGEDFTVLISINQTSEIIPSNMFCCICSVNLKIDEVFSLN